MQHSTGRGNYRFRRQVDFLGQLVECPRLRQAVAQDASGSDNVAPTLAPAHRASLADTILTILVGHVVRRSLGDTMSTTVPLGMA